MLSPAVVVGITAGIVYITAGSGLLLLRPARPGLAAFALYELTIGASLVASYLGVVIGANALVIAGNPLVGLSAVALMLATAQYASLPRTLLVVPFLGAAAAAVVLLFVFPSGMLRAGGLINDYGVILWQLPLFIAASISAIVFERRLRAATAPESRTEHLVLLLAIVPHLGYISTVSILSIAGLPEIEKTIWGNGYFVTFGAGILVTLYVALSLWRAGHRAARMLAGLSVLVLFLGAGQWLFYRSTYPEIVVYGGIFRLIAAGAMAYALLKYHIFGIDLKIKWTLDRGMLVGIFGVVFFLVDQAAQFFVSDAYGALAGVVAALLLVFALAPLRKLTHRLADRLMPHTHATPEYFAERKLTIYRAAAASAARDGEISADERRMLDALIQELGLDAGEAHAIETRALAGLAA